MDAEIDFEALPPNLSTFSTLLTVRDLATLVDDHAAAVWRGDEDIDGAFYQWLAACWHTSVEAEPRDLPVALSILAAGGTGIRWHETATAIVGYIPGRQGARYVVSKSSIPPGLKLRT